MPSENFSAAQQAAQEALDRVITCISEGQSFILEAGAGAGKTYSLVQALRYIIEKQGDLLLRKNQRIACITYTNVAKDEIRTRTDNHPAVFADTIHAFCWGLLRNFQPDLRSALSTLPHWRERMSEIGGDIKDRIIRYELGYPEIKDREILLAHDDVIALMTLFLQKPKFKALLTKQFPLLLIDEYQDTDKAFADALKQQFLETNQAPLIGLFGDHWQKIYDNGCGVIESSYLTIIEKRSNFRSNRQIVEVLNHMRPELPQEAQDTTEGGSVSAYHTNNWQGQRRTETHWKDDLPAHEAHNCLQKLRRQLESEGWDFTPDKTKILMLTHNVLAEEQGYRNLAGVFSRKESFIKKEDHHIAFLVDIVEAACSAYEDRRFGDMFAILDAKFSIHRHADKVRWAKDMDALLTLRRDGTIGEVLDHLRATRHPQLPDKVEYKENRLNLLSDETGSLSDKERKSLERVQKIRGIKFTEISALAKFIEDRTPFSTKHNVKGAEFENVLVVVGRGWNYYNFGQMLEWMPPNSTPTEKEDVYERNRNLFYVACSRPKKRLSLLFTQKLSDAALKELATLFGEDAVRYCP